MTDPDCLFCKIVAGDIPAEVVVETDRAVAFRDLDPQAPVHVLVVPRDHHPNAAALATSDAAVAAHLVEVAARVVGQEGLEDYRLVFNTGPDAGQTVFHVHLHVLAGRSFGWPPG
jgi:histidine triad (HIT) family protein